MLLLRIEDTDVERSTQEMTQGILDAMTWIGLTGMKVRSISPGFVNPRGGGCLLKRTLLTVVHAGPSRTRRVP